MMIPARAIGGDFYYFIPLGDDLLGVVVGDVSDKGVPAALFMALTYNLVRAEASRTCTPGESLRTVNRHLLDINVTNMFVTLLYSILHYSRGKFSYARAGHLPRLFWIGTTSRSARLRRPARRLDYSQDPGLMSRLWIFPPAAGC